MSYAEVHLIVQFSYKFFNECQPRFLSIYSFICCALFDVKTFQSYVEEAANSSENIFHQSPLQKHQLLKMKKWL